MFGTDWASKAARPGLAMDAPERRKSLTTFLARIGAVLQETMRSRLIA